MPGSAKNKKHVTTKTGWLKINVAWSKKSQFLLWHSDGTVRIWHKQHESKDPTFLVSTVQSGGGVMVRGMFSWHALDPLIPIEYEYQRIPKHCCLSCASLCGTVYTFSSKLKLHVTKHTSSQAESAGKNWQELQDAIESARRNASSTLNPCYETNVVLEAKRSPIQYKTVRVSKSGQ